MWGRLLVTAALLACPGSAFADPLKASEIVQHITGRWWEPISNPAPWSHTCDGKAEIMRIEPDGTLTAGDERDTEGVHSVRNVVIEIPKILDGKEADYILAHAPARNSEGTSQQALSLRIEMPDKNTMVSTLLPVNPRPITQKRCP